MSKKVGIPILLMVILICPLLSTSFGYSTTNYYYNYNGDDEGTCGLPHTTMCKSPPDLVIDPQSTQPPRAMIISYDEYQHGMGEHHEESGDIISGVANVGYGIVDLAVGDGINCINRSIIQRKWDGETAISCALATPWGKAFKAGKVMAGAMGFIKAGEKAGEVASKASKVVKASEEAEKALIKKGLSEDVIKKYREKGVNINKLNNALDKLKGVMGYEKILKRIKEDGDAGATYEAIVAAEKCNVDEIVELSKGRIKTVKGSTEADIITIDKVIECKGGDVTKNWNGFTKQLSRLSEYAKNNNKKLVYYFRLEPDDKVIKKLNKAKSEYGVDIEYHVYNP